MKKITIEEYFESLTSQENAHTEKLFIKAQEKLHDNITKDVSELVKTLTVGDINPPKDFVFMLYFRMLWDRIQKFYGNDELETLKGLFLRIMSENENDFGDDVIEIDRRSLN